jgi:pimeloyl-ACP methyl ester carboxylesterase
MPAASFRSMLAPALDGFPDGSLDAAMSTVRVLDDGTIQRRLSVPRHLEILYSLWQDDPRQWYPQVRARTVLMPAVEVGAPLDPEIGAALAAIEQARLRPFPGAHHDVHLQRPVEVAEEIGSLA